MVTRTKRLLIDDIDGSEAASTVTFGVSGKSYEIDLSDVNLGALRSVLEPYMTAGRRTGTHQRVSATQTGAKTDPHAARAARQWAQSEGIEVPVRGRVPAAILEQWRNR